MTTLDSFKGFLKPDGGKFFLVLLFAAFSVYFLYFLPFPGDVFAWLYLPLYLLVFLPYFVVYNSFSYGYLESGTVIVLMVLQLIYWYAISCVIVFLNDRFGFVAVIQKKFSVGDDTLKFALKMAGILLFILVVLVLLNVHVLLCNALGGYWGISYPGQKPYCHLPTSTAGKACNDSGQCVGYCIGENENSTEGVCETYGDIGGCFFYVVNGKAKSLCY